MITQLRRIILAVALFAAASPAIADEPSPVAKYSPEVQNIYNHYLLSWHASGRSLAFESVRLVSEQASSAQSRVLDTRLSNATVNPMGIPVESMTLETGATTSYDSRIDYRPDGNSIATSQVFFGGDLAATDDPQLERTRWIQVAPFSLEQFILHQLSLASFDQSTTYADVYLSMNPYVSPNGGLWVNWTEAHAGLDHEQVHALGESLRQTELAAIFQQSLSLIEDESSCLLLAPVRSTNAGWFRCPVDELLSLAYLTNIRGVTIDWPDRIVPHLRGDRFRADDGAQLDLALSPPNPSISLHDGGTPLPSKGSSNIIVSLIDPDGYFKIDTHPAFDDAAGNSRVAEMYRTTTGSGTLTSSVGGTFNGHGSGIIGAFANVTGGQDSSLTAPAAQDRSYAAWGAELVTYWASGPAMVLAIEHAANSTTGSNADIIQASVGSVPWDGICAAGDTLFQDWRDAWDYAAFFGSLGVVSAGNDVLRTTDSCTASALATRDDIVVVGGFGREGMNAQDFTIYDQEPLFSAGTNMFLPENCTLNTANPDLCTRSAIGGAPLRISDDVVIAQARSRIDLATVDRLQFSAMVDSDDSILYQNPTGVQTGGTSQAAPAAAAALVSLLDFAGEQNELLFRQVGTKHVNALLMADGPYPGWERRIRQSPPMLTSGTGMHDSWGAGRLKMRRLDEDGLRQPAGWGTGVDVLEDGDVLDILVGMGPMPGEVDQVLATAAWDEPYLSPANTDEHAAIIWAALVVTPPTITSSLIDDPEIPDPTGPIQPPNIDPGVIGTPGEFNPFSFACENPQGVAGTLLLVDGSFDTHKMLRARSDLAPSFQNLCVWIRLYAIRIPDGESRRVYRAYLYEDLDQDDPSEPDPEIE